MLRTVTIKPNGHRQPVPRGGLLTRCYKVGRFQLTINQRLDPVPVLQTLSRMQVWKPYQPIWEDLNRAERAAYRRARDEFAQVVANITGKEVVIMESDEQ